MQSEQTLWIPDFSWGFWGSLATERRWVYGHIQDHAVALNDGNRSVFVQPGDIVELYDHGTVVQPVERPDYVYDVVDHRKLLSEDWEIFRSVEKDANEPYVEIWSDVSPGIYANCFTSDQFDIGWHMYPVARGSNIVPFRLKGVVLDIYVQLVKEEEGGQNILIWEGQIQSSTQIYIDVELHVSLENAEEN